MSFDKRRVRKPDLMTWVAVSVMVGVAVSAALPYLN
jgi:hypothetical protein